MPDKTGSAILPYVSTRGGVTDPESSGEPGPVIPDETFESAPGRNSGSRFSESTFSESLNRF